MYCLRFIGHAKFNNSVLAYSILLLDRVNNIMSDHNSITFSLGLMLHFQMIRVSSWKCIFDMVLQVLLFSGKEIATALSTLNALVISNRGHGHPYCGCEFAFVVCSEIVPLILFNNLNIWLVHFKGFYNQFKTIL